MDGVCVIWDNTKQILNEIERLLVCSQCEKLVEVPCTLGSCEHFFCRDCVQDCQVEACPVCQLPSFAKDLQESRQVATAVSLCKQLRHLLSLPASINVEDGSPTGETELRKSNHDVASNPCQTICDNPTQTRSICDKTAPLDHVDDSDVPGRNPMHVSNQDDRAIIEVIDKQSVYNFEDPVNSGSPVSPIHRRTRGAKKKRQKQEFLKQSNKDWGIGENEFVKCGSCKRTRSRHITFSNTNHILQQTEPPADDLPEPKMTLNFAECIRKDDSTSSEESVVNIQRKTSATRRRRRPVKRKARITTQNEMTEYLHISEPDTRCDQFIDEAQRDAVIDAQCQGDLDVQYEADIDARCDTNVLDDVMEGCSDADKPTTSANHNTTQPWPLVSLVSQEFHAVKPSVEAEKAKTAVCSPVTSLPPQKCHSPGKQGLPEEDNNSFESIKSLISKKYRSPRRRSLPERAKHVRTSQVTQTFRSPRRRSLPERVNTADWTPTSRDTRNQPWPSPAEVTPKSVRRSSLGRFSSPLGGMFSPSGFSPSRNGSPAAMKRNAKGETRLHIACIKGDYDSAVTLLKEGAGPNIKDNAGWTPLHEACNHGHIRLVELLLDHGTFINMPGCENDTPLHDAMQNNRLDCVRLLVSRGATLTTRNIHGKTPLDLAVSDAMKKALKTQVNRTKWIETETLCPTPEIHQVVLLSTGLSREQKMKLQKCSGLLHAKLLQDFSNEVTHVVTSVNKDGMCPRTLKYLQAVLTGKWIVNFDWVETCQEYKDRVPEEPFEVPGTSANPNSQAPNKGRLNTEQQLPGLFDGCQFYLQGEFSYPTPEKEELVNLLKAGGGTVLSREPKIDSIIDQSELTVPYHADPDSQLKNCCYYIVHDIKTAGGVMHGERMCSAPASWLMDCVAYFTLLPLPSPS